MNVKTLSIYTLLLAFLPLFVVGQCLIHTDKAFYVSGETVHYQLYLSNNLAQKSMTIRGTIYNESGQKVHEYFYKNEGKASIGGYFRVPYDLSSGVYKLVFLASSQNGIQTHELASIFIPIYNDLEPISSNASEMELSANEPLQDLNVQVNLTPPSFGNRTTANVDITVTDQNGTPVQSTLSVNILDQKSAMLFGDRNVVKSDIDIQLATPDNNLFYQGRVFDTLDQPLQSKIIGAYSSLNQKMIYTKTMSANLFALKLDDFYGEKPIQFIGSQKEVPFIDIEIVQNLGKETNFPALIVNEEILSYLEESRLRKKMAQYYESMQVDQTIEAVKPAVEKLKNDFTYDIRKYVEFATIGDFFSELLTPLRFRLEDELYSAKMYNPTSRKSLNNELSGVPLFIIDGQMTRDADFIARLKLTKVNTVDLFFKPETIRPQFNILGLSGIAMIDTENLEFDLPEQDARDIFIMNGFQPAQTQEGQPAILDLAPKDPYFTTQLFWQAGITTDANGKVTVPFTQSDDLSNFVIQVVARGANGNYGQGKVVYTVSN